MQLQASFTGMTGAAVRRQKERPCEPKQALAGLRLPLHAMGIQDRFNSVPPQALHCGHSEHCLIQMNM